MSMTTTMSNPGDDRDKSGYESSDAHTGLIWIVAAGLVRLHGRVEGWKLVLVLIAVFALVSVAR